LLKGASLVGVFWGDFAKREPQNNAAMMQELSQWWAQGRIKPVIDRTMPMSELFAAYERMGSRQYRASWCWSTRKAAVTAAMPVGSGRYFQPRLQNPTPQHRHVFSSSRAAPDRRRFLIASSLATAVGALPAWVRATESLAHNPFTLGVASGDQADNILIWTRLTAPLAYLGTAVAQTWQHRPCIGKWPMMPSSARPWPMGRSRPGPNGVMPSMCRSSGLSPDRWYFYRFRCGDAFSTTARCRTAPAPEPISCAWP
jgi:hypothetical protein